MMHEPGDEGRVPDSFEYYMLRLARSARDPDRVAGLIERLGSGQKRSFDTGEQLVRLICAGLALDLNMQPEVDHRNATEGEITSPSLGVAD